MERAPNLSVVPYAGAWSDLGDWQAVWREAEADTTGTVTAGPANALDCRDTLLQATSETQQLVGIGLKDIVAVAMPDAVLVAHKDRAQEVKQAVAALKAKAVPQAETLPRDYRPWGWYESLVVGPAVSGETHRRPPRRRAVAAKPSPPRRTLDRRRGHGQGDRR